MANILDLVKPEAVIILASPSSPSVPANLSSLQRYYRLGQQYVLETFEQLLPILRENYRSHLIILGGLGLGDLSNSINYYQPATIEMRDPAIEETTGFAPSFHLVIMPHSVDMQQAIYLADLANQRLNTPDPELRAAQSLALGWKETGITPQRVIPPIHPRPSPVIRQAPANLEEYVEYRGLGRSDGQTYLDRSRSTAYWNKVIPGEDGFWVEKIQGPYLIPKILHLVGTPSANRLAKVRWSMILKKGWEIRLVSTLETSSVPREWLGLLETSNPEERVRRMGLISLMMKGGFAVSSSKVGVKPIPEWWRKYHLVVSSRGEEVNARMIGSIPGMVDQTDRVDFHPSVKPFIGSNGFYRSVQLEKINKPPGDVPYEPVFFEEIRKIVSKGATLEDALREMISNRNDATYLVIPSHTEVVVEIPSEPRPKIIVEKVLPLRSHVLTPESIMSELSLR